MATRIQLRRDTAANWSAANPVLAYGEAGYDGTNNKFKVGDGNKTWNELPYLQAPPPDLSIYATKTELGQESSARAQGDQQLEAEIQQLAGDVSGNEQALDGLTAAVGAADAKADTAISKANANEAAIEELDGRVSDLEEGDGGSSTVLSWDFAGTTYFQDPGSGGIGVHPDGITIYVSKTNADGNDISAEFLNEMVAGNLFTLQVPERTDGDTGNVRQYMQFSISQNPVNQGSWWNVATQRIINANSQNEWSIGEYLDIVVQVAPTTRTLLIDEESNPDDIITDPELISAWEAYKLAQGWEDDYIATQKDVNHFFNQVDHMQQAELRQQREHISELLDRVVELEGTGTGGGINEAPMDGQQYARQDGAWEVVDFDAPMHLEFEWQGEEWWPDKVKEGEMFGHKSESTLFFANVDENGIYASPILDTAVKPGTTVLVTKTKDRSRWAHFTATSGTSIQSWGRSFNCRLNGKSEKEIKEDDDVTVMFNVTAPALSPQEGVYPIEIDDIFEELAKFKKQISALKGELTKIKKNNANTGT
jgi:hypothetical protein